MIDGWTDERIALLKTLWNTDGLSAKQCSTVLGVTRNAIIGKVHRLKLEKRGVSVKASSETGGRGAAGKYSGVARDAQKARSARLKQKLFKLPPPEVFAPDADDLAVGAWAALPDTVPVSLEALSHDSCRWPIGDNAPFLFCGCKTATGSSYCPTHKHRSAGVGTAEERRAKRSAVTISRLEVKNGFRQQQAGQSL